MFYLIFFCKSVLLPMSFSETLLKIHSCLIVTNRLIVIFLEGKGF